MSLPVSLYKTQLTTIQIRIFISSRPLHSHYTYKYTQTQNIYHDSFWKDLYLVNLSVNFLRFYTQSGLLESVSSLHDFYFLLGSILGVFVIPRLYRHKLTPGHLDNYRRT